MKMHLIVVMVLSLFLIEQMSAQELEKLGIDTKANFELMPLKIGDLAPEILATDHREEQFSLTETLKENRVVLLFYRAYWCPVCKKHLSEFEQDLYKLTEKNVQVVVVSPETDENIEKTIRKTKLSTRVISDKDYSIMEDYGVAFKVTEKYQKKIKTFLFADIAEYNGQDEAVLPIPATYLIGQDGRIAYVHFDPNYKNRASVEDLLKHID
jgi:peroxiredoxin